MNKTKIQTTTILLVTVLLMLATTNIHRVHANPANYDVKLTFHKLPSAVTLWTGNTTQYIMNTTSTGYYSTSNQTSSVSLASNDTYYTLQIFYLYPKLAGQLTIASQTALPLKLYLNSSSSVSDIAIKTSMWKVNSADGTATNIGTNATHTSLSLNSNVQLKSISGVVFSSSVTVESNYYLKLVIEVKTTASAPVDVMLTFDTSSCPSRIDRLTVTDHITVTVNTYSGSTASTEFTWGDTINITATVTDAFGGYDLSTVKMYFIPDGFPSVILPSGYGTGTRISGSDTSYTNVYYYLYTPNSTEYVPNRWTPYARVTDKNDNTITNSGTKIGVSGPGGESPPPDLPFELPSFFYIFGPQFALMFFVAVIFVIVIAGIAIYIAVKGIR